MRSCSCCHSSWLENVDVYKVHQPDCRCKPQECQRPDRIAPEHDGHHRALDEIDLQEPYHPRRQVEALVPDELVPAFPVSVVVNRQNQEVQIKQADGRIQWIHYNSLCRPSGRLLINQVPRNPTPMINREESRTLSPFLASSINHSTVPPVFMEILW